MRRLHLIGTTILALASACSSSTDGGAPAPDASDDAGADGMASASDGASVADVRGH